MSLYSTQLLRTSATHDPSAAAVVDSVWNTICDTVATTTSSLFSQFAQSVIVKALENIKHGELRIVTPTETLTFGKLEKHSPPELRAEIYVRDPAFWMRVLLSNDLGFAEAFMYGDVNCEDIPAFLCFFIANRSNIQINSFATSLFSAPRFLTASRFLGDLTNTRANISAHYDLGEMLFASFLSPDMNYSCGIFKDLAEYPSLGSMELESLEDAQIRKMRTIIARANIRKGHRVLEIGSGWGALAILAVQTTGCTVETITLSEDQQTLANARIKAAGLSEEIRVHLMDYRDCTLRPEWEHAFDRFVSVEMMEHLGKDFTSTFWGVVDWALKKNDAVGCVQVTTLPEARVENYDRGADFIQKWAHPRVIQIFPGAYIPSCTHLIAMMTSGSDGRLTTESVSNIGPHYPRTLREWKRKFLENFSSLIAPALRGQYGLSNADLEIFKRKWIYYFDYCDAGFSTRSLGVHVIAFTREGNVALGCTSSSL